MKHIVSFAVLIVMAISILSLPANAASTEEIIVTYFEDGSYMTETIIVSNARASGTKTASKVKNYYDGSGNLDWKATLTGTYTYTGSSSTCTSSSINVTIYDSAWYTISKSATKSGNTAYATVTMGQKMLGVTVSEVPASISLKCDANGNLS